MDYNKELERTKKFYEKNDEAIERATTCCIGLKSHLKSGKHSLTILPHRPPNQKADYASVIKDLDMLADITEIATRVYSAKTKAVEQEKKQEHL